MEGRRGFDRASHAAFKRDLWTHGGAATSREQQIAVGRCAVIANEGTPAASKALLPLPDSRGILNKWKSPVSSELPPPPSSCPRNYGSAA
ncbi:hypothetical protein K0M31_011980 [Melipona bicolor]|uniref:Uncharacterized protein n=1 Tax=Melipona bicolor TaxID=60889 RepID=A0AA40KV86_9HYME|nr:hypothetical protein K0M31_011980 [Melipona bicolor]